MIDPKNMAFVKAKEFGGKIIGRSNRHSKEFLPRPPSYVRLSNKNKDIDDGKYDDQGGGTPKGHVPVMVGNEEGKWKKFVVPTWFMKDPSIVALLQLSADEFGYNHQGVLQIPCDIEVFQSIIAKLSKKGRSLSL